MLEILQKTWKTNQVEGRVLEVQLEWPNELN